jgi:hypothetical protein
MTEILLGKGVKNKTTKERLLLKNPKSKRLDIFGMKHLLVSVNQFIPKNNWPIFLICI